MVDVVVIGAGISGLSSAMLLLKHGLKVTVLEARDRVGGRTFTQRDSACGGYSDLGGAYVGPTQRRVARLAHQFGLQFYKISEEKPTLMTFRDKWMTYQGTIPPIYNPFVAMDINNLQQVVDSMARTVPPDAPWRAEKAEEWDKMTVKEMVDKICWTEFARSSAALICRAVLCAEMHEVSALAFLWYMSSGQGLQRVINITNGAQERKFVGGAQQLSEHMAMALGDRVHLSSPVIRVEQLDDCVNVSYVH
jgi:monoamine oxidase